MSNRQAHQQPHRPPPRDCGRQTISTTALQVWHAAMASSPGAYHRQSAAWAARACPSTLDMTMSHAHPQHSAAAVTCLPSLIKTCWSPSHLALGGAHEPPAQQWNAHALSVSCHQLVPHSLVHVTVQLIDLLLSRQQVCQRHNLVPVLCAQHHVVARVFATTALGACSSASHISNHPRSGIQSSGSVFSPDQCNHLHGGIVTNSTAIKSDNYLCVCSTYVHWLPACRGSSCWD